MRGSGRGEFAFGEKAQCLGIDPVLLDQYPVGKGLRRIAGEDSNLGLEDGWAFIEAGRDEVNGAAMPGGSVGKGALMSVKTLIERQ